MTRYEAKPILVSQLILLVWARVIIEHTLHRGQSVRHGRLVHGVPRERGGGKTQGQGEALDKMHCF